MQRDIDRSEALRYILRFFNERRPQKQTRKGIARLKKYFQTAHFPDQQPLEAWVKGSKELENEQLQEALR